MDLERIQKSLIHLCGPSQLPGASELQSAFDELRETLNQLMQIEGDFQHSLASEVERLRWLEELRHTVASSGGLIGNVTFASFPDEGLGLGAVADIKAGQLLMKIPRSAMLTHEDALACPAWSPHLSGDPMCSRMPNACLALYLLHHRCLGAGSPHAAYIRCLPSGFANCLSFDSLAYRRLTTVDARERVLAEWRNAARQYLYFARLLARLRQQQDSRRLPMAEAGRFTYAAYRWAVSTVMSRNNAVPSANGQGAATLALIPLWDMGNHRFGQMSTDYSPEEQCLLFYAMEEARCGCQVHFMYGARSSTEFLLYSGFAIGHGNNPHDTGDLRLGLNPRDKLIDEKSKCLAAMGMERSHSFHLPVENPLTPQVLSFARVMCAQTVDEVTAAGSATSDGGGGGDLNRRAGVFLANRCRLLSLSQQAATTEAEGDADGSSAAAMCGRFAAAERMKFAQLATAFQRWSEAEAGADTS